MINRCSVEDASPTTEDTYSSGAVFKLHEPLRNSWIKLLNCGITNMKSVSICYKRFNDIHLNKEDKRIRVNIHLNAIQKSDLF